MEQQQDQEPPLGGTFSSQMTFTVTPMGSFVNFNKIESSYEAFKKFEQHLQNSNMTYDYPKQYINNNCMNTISLPPQFAQINQQYQFSQENNLIQNLESNSRLAQSNLQFGAIDSMFINYEATNLQSVFEQNQNLYFGQNQNYQFNQSVKHADANQNHNNDISRDLTHKLNEVFLDQQRHEQMNYKPKNADSDKFFSDCFIKVNNTQEVEADDENISYCPPKSRPNSQKDFDELRDYIKKMEQKRIKEQLANGNHKKQLQRKTSEQLQGLEDAYEQNHNWSYGQKLLLSAELNLTFNQVTKWNWDRKQNEGRILQRKSKREKKLLEKKSKSKQKSIKTQNIIQNS
eukprot:403349208